MWFCSSRDKGKLNTSIWQGSNGLLHNKKCFSGIFYENLCQFFFVKFHALKFWEEKFDSFDWFFQKERKKKKLGWPCSLGLVGGVQPNIFFLGLNAILIYFPFVLHFGYCQSKNDALWKGQGPQGIVIYLPTIGLQYINCIHFPFHNCSLVGTAPKPKLNIDILCTDWVKLQHFWE